MPQLPRASSLQGQLALLWVFILLVSLALGAVLVGLYQRGSAGEIEAGQRAAGYSATIWMRTARQSG